MRAAALVFLQLIGLALCGVIEPLQSGGHPTNIVGGEDAKLDEFPYQVSLKTALEKEHFCGGSVINENFVLTVAQCCVIQEKFVEAGGVNVLHDEGVEQRVNISKIFVHPKFKHLENDICLLKLATPLDLETSHVKPVKLPNPMQETADGTMATTTGWGRTRPLRFLGSEHLKKITVPIVSDESCRTIYHSLFTLDDIEILDSMICAGYDQGGMAPCQGDLGSPMVDASSKVLLGMVSWAKGCARPRLPVVHTELSYYVDWIHSVIKTN